MKVYICPICGDKNIDEDIELDGDKIVGGGTFFCYDCEREVIPLATPQEMI